MEVNGLPYTDWSTLDPGACCPNFDPAKWDRLDLHFRDKRFVRVRSTCCFHIPLNMGPVLDRTRRAIIDASADDREYIVLTDDHSLWYSDHFFSVTKEVPGLDNVRISGDFITRVLEGPYSHAYVWVHEMQNVVAESGRSMARLLFYYTTCPKCAERRGKNYVFGVAEVV